MGEFALYSCQDQADRGPFEERGLQIPILWLAAPCVASDQGRPARSLPLLGHLASGFD